MTFIVVFILGSVVGISISYWEKYRFKSQLKKMCDRGSDTAELADSLSLQSLVRREIAYLHQQRQALEESLQSWQNVLDRAPFGYLQVDEENQLLWCNQQARQLLKIDRWQPGQIRLLLELVRSYELDRLIEQTRVSQQSQTQTWVFYPTYYLGEPKNREPQKVPLISEKSIALKAFSLPLSQGQVGVFLENQQPLMELSRSRDRAFSDLTHELRTPLTSISLLAETLQKRVQDPERRWVEQMLSQTQRLIDLVQDWLEIGQLQENPSQYLQYESVEIRQLITVAWQSLEVLAKQKGLSLDYCGVDRAYLEGDKSRLIQVFLNLFDNAIKHSPPKAAIRVDLKAVDPGEIEINVIDCGSGFADTDLPYVFDRLYRGDRSRTRQSSDTFPSRQGSGLGLSIVREIIQAHGGTIEAKNHPETGGAWLQLHFTSPQSSAI